MTLKQFLYACSNEMYLSTDNDSWPNQFRQRCVRYSSLFTEISIAEERKDFTGLFDRKIKYLSGGGIYTEFINPIHTIEIILEEENSNEG